MVRDFTEAVPRESIPLFTMVVGDIQTRRALASYCEMVEAGLPAVPDVGFAFFEPESRLWADWINSQRDLRAVSIFCGGRKIHAEIRAHRGTVEDIALLRQAVRQEVTFILGGVHAPSRLVDYRRAAPGRRLVICNGMAYSLAQRRRLLQPARGVHLSVGRDAELSPGRNQAQLIRRCLSRAAI